MLTLLVVPSLGRHFLFSFRKTSSFFRLRTTHVIYGLTDHTYFMSSFPEVFGHLAHVSLLYQCLMMPMHPIHCWRNWKRLHRQARVVTKKTDVFPQNKAMLHSRLLCSSHQPLRFLVCRVGNPEGFFKTAPDLAAPIFQGSGHFPQGKPLDSCTSSAFGNCDTDRSLHSPRVRGGSC